MGNTFCLWITGLAGSGKTTLAERICSELKEKGSPAVLIDGDRLRDVFANTGYKREQRILLAKQYANLCRELNSQGFSTVCATISMFEEVYQHNRTQLPNYVEVFLDVGFDVLTARDKKGLYSGADAGTVQDVVGKDIAFDSPNDAHLRLVNDQVDLNAQRVLELLKSKLYI